MNSEAKSRTDFVLISAQFVNNLIDRGIFGTAARKRSGLSAATIKRWRAQAKVTLTFRAKLASVVQVIESVFDRKCDPHVTGLPGPTCDRVRLCLGIPGPVDGSMRHGADTFRQSAGIALLVESDPVLLVTISVLRLWTERKSNSTKGVVAGIDNSLRHSDSLIALADQLLAPLTASAPLKPVEAFLLAAAATLHDIGHFQDLKLGGDPSLPRWVKHHADLGADEIEGFARDRFDSVLQKCVREVTGEDAELAEKCLKLLRRLAPLLSLCVRYHNLSRDHFQVDLELEDALRASSDLLFDCQQTRDRISSLIATLHIADNLERNNTRIFPARLERLEIRITEQGVRGLTAEEQEELCRLLRYRSFGRPTISYNPGQNEVNVRYVTRFNPGVVGNPLFARFRQELEFSLTSKMNKLIRTWERTTNTTLTVSSLAEDPVESQVTAEMAIRLDHFLKNRTAASLHAISDTILDKTAGELSWLKKCHPRGVLFGGATAARHEYSLGTDYSGAHASCPINGSWI